MTQTNKSCFSAGVLNGGLGNAHLNKAFAGFNIPQMGWNTFKTHEKEVGLVVEEMARDSCVRASMEERQQTIENAEKMKPLL